MIQVSKLAPSERALNELARFVGEQNRDEAHQIGYLDADPAQIEKFLMERDLPPHDSWVVARQAGQPIGAFGFDADGELGRAWLYGPFVRHNDWAAIADRLWAALQELLPAGLHEHELFYNIHNADCIAFAERHHFPILGDGLILRFGRESLAELPDSEARELAEAERTAFQA